jgi:lipoprotein-anchoring transpeptidase ErfK/SrfK
MEERTMWKSPRRIALVSTAVVLTASGVLGIAWLADWLPIRLESPQAGEFAEGDAGEYSLDGFTDLPSGRFANANAGSGGSTDAGYALATDDPIFESQSEPDFGTASVGDATANTPSDALWLLESTTERNAASDISGSNRDPGTDPTMPERFPAIAAGEQPAIGNTGNGTGLFNRTTQPHEVVDQAVYGGSPDRSRVNLTSGESAPSAPGQVFRSEGPQTLRQARSFPTQVAFVDQSAGDGSSGQSNANITSAENAGVDASVSPTPAPAGVDLSEIDALLASGDYVNAHRQLSTIYWNQPELQPQIMERLDRNAEFIYFRPQPHFLEPYVIQTGDLLQRVAPRYRVNWEYLAAINNIDPRRIRPGQKLKVIKGPFSAFIDLSNFVLTIHCHGFYVKRFPIGIGKDGSTPTGRFTVLERVPNPQYTDPNGRVIAGDDPANPLGEYWLDLGDSYGIHGTIEPDSIGKDASRGCIRMHNSDVAQVYNFLVRGSEVSIRP